MGYLQSLALAGWANAQVFPIVSPAIVDLLDVGRVRLQVAVLD
jgi:hypothetical protein